MDDSALHLEPLHHRDTRCIAIVGRMGSAADKAVRSFPERKFSKTHGCWYVAFEKEVLQKLTELLGTFQQVTVSNRFADWDESVGSGVGVIALPEGYHECLVRVRYSEATVKTYESQMRLFIGWLGPRTLEDLSDAIINDYQLYLASVRKVSISTQNTAVNAIKFYLEKVHHGERKVYYVERPMKETKLPRPLSQEEVKALIEATKNVKHRCMVMLLYATGLRISELLNLRWKDFDEERGQLFVNGGKGRKDRMTLVSKASLEYVRYYMGLFEPKEYLFEGPDGGKYSPRSVNQVIHRSAAAAGITKQVSAHTLRHSFATHLLEQKTDIRYIQVLMGHESSKTTERYTHVTTRGFSVIKSPLDNLGLDFMPPKDENQKHE